ncbi:hypothetical protein [Streptomyces sp. ODS28]|uniref:hypothetical protein n=1 Tax=Streptomyces sp. ODS28 TaxID=3136688 RepID=UPI0031EE50B8
MWPGQQPNGDQNAPNPYQQGQGQNAQQQPNPYQQPGPGYPQQGQQGYPQPNPYQQGQPPQGRPPQPNPYAQQPGQQMPGQPWPPQGAPGGPQGPGGGGGGGMSKAAVIAVSAAAAVIAIAVGGFFLFQSGDDSEDTAADKKPAQSSKKQTAGQEKSKDGSDPVHPGWQAVLSDKYYTAFDVPKSAGWKVNPQAVQYVIENDKTKKPVLVMSGTAGFKDKFCEDSPLAVVGTKGAKGSKSDKEAAEVAAANFAIGGFDQKQKGKLTKSGGKPFTNEHGVHGYAASAVVTGAPKKHGCSPTAGKVVTAAFANEHGERVVWVHSTAAGVDGEVPDATIKQMIASLRPYEEPSGTRG